MEKKLKGAAVVGQSGGPTAAINATLAGVISGASAAHDAGIITHLYGMRHGIEGMTEEKMLVLDRYFRDEEALSLLCDTPASALGSCRMKLPQDINDSIYDKIFAVFARYDIRYFFYIGGNDSMDTVSKLSAAKKRFDYEIRFIGVPKTIDNDLMFTDHTPGFGSAAKFVACTMAEIIRDCSVYTKRAVTIVEVMGRDAGWLTAASSLASAAGQRGVDLIYLPEVPFSTDRFISSVRQCLEIHPDVVVAVSEGLRSADGTYICENTGTGAVDVFGNRSLSGTAKVLEQLVRKEIGCKVRSIELNLPQRCASHLASDTDITESREIGCRAVAFAVQGISGHMMAYARVSDSPYKTEIVSADVTDIANKIKKIPSEMICESGDGVTDAMVRYLSPLIMGERTVKYINGVMQHFSFEE